MTNSLLQRWKIEAKVAAAAAGTAACGIGVAVLNDVEGDHSLMGATPAWAQTLILVVAPTLISFLAGWKAKHTPRTPVLSAISAPPAAQPAGPVAPAAAAPPAVTPPPTAPSGDTTGA